jgi:hypothetical protein
MNECIDSTMGLIPRMLAVLLTRDDPRTSWSFQDPPQPGDSRPVIPPSQVRLSTQQALSRQMMKDWEVWSTNI